MNTRESGAEAESFAAGWLVKQGYTILDRNFFMKGGELDIVAKKGDTLAFVEVRSWDHQFWDGGTPLETIHPAKIKHIIKTATYYIQSKRMHFQAHVAGSRGGSAVFDIPSGGNQGVLEPSLTWRPN